MTKHFYALALGADRHLTCHGQRTADTNTRSSLILPSASRPDPHGAPKTVAPAVTCALNGRPEIRP